MDNASVMTIVIGVAKRRSRSGVEMADLIGIGRQAMAEYETSWLAYRGSQDFREWAEARIERWIDVYTAAHYRPAPGELVSPSARRSAKPGGAHGMVSVVDSTTEKQTASVTEAASTLGISERHAYELIRRGEFPVPVVHLGRRVVVPLAPLRKLLAGEGDTAA